MKNLISALSLTALLLPIVLSGQDKQFVSPRNLWSFYTPQWFSPEEYSHARFSDTLTIINGRGYRQLLRESANYPGWSGYGTYMREENGRVYTLDFSGNEELVYDFTLVKGDSLESIVNSYKTKLKVDSTNTLVTNDGVSRKRLYLSLYCQGNLVEKPIWVEGIGDIDKRTFFSMSHKCIIMDPEKVLTCFYVDNKPVLMDWGCKNNLEAYLSMVDWRYIWQVDHQVTGLPSSVTRLYRFGGTVEVNNKVYTQLLKADNILPTSVDWVPTGRFFRHEDGKIFGLKEDREYLIMDFTLEQGDSLTLDYNSSPVKIYVLKTDIVKYKDNKTRKRLYLGCEPEDTPDENQVWVYGLGDPGIFLDYPGLGCSLYDPLERDDIVCILNYDYYSVYTAPGAQECFKAGTYPENSPKSTKILAIPNPASDVVTFSAAAPFEGLLVIRDLSGRVVLRQNTQTSHSHIEADIRHLNEGLFIYSLTLKNGNHHTGKLSVRK